MGNTLPLFSWGPPVQRVLIVGPEYARWARLCLQLQGGAKGVVLDDAGPWELPNGWSLCSNETSARDFVTQHLRAVRKHGGPKQPEGVVLAGLDVTSRLLQTVMETPSLLAVVTTEGSAWYWSDHYAKRFDVVIFLTPYVTSYRASVYEFTPGQQLANVLQTHLPTSQCPLVWQRGQGWFRWPWPGNA